jgi:hypothetical protein
MKVPKWRSLNGGGEIEVPKWRSLNGGGEIEVPERRSLNGGCHLFGECGLGINVSHVCLVIGNFGDLIQFPNLAQKCKELKTFTPLNPG